MSTLKKNNYNDGTKLNTRAYSWDFVIYEIEKTYLQSRLDTLIKNGFVKHYAYIEHNNDVVIDDNGAEVKKPSHTHLLIVFDQNISVKQFKERILFYTEHNIFGQPLKDKRGAYRYLTHKDDIDKYQYSDEFIISNDDYFSKEDHIFNKSKDADEINQMIDDFSNLSYRDLACKYGRDFIKNFKSYEYYFSLVLEQEKSKGTSLCKKACEG